MPEGPLVGIEEHLLGFSRVGDRQEHPAVAEEHMGHLHHLRQAPDLYHLVAPVELVGLARGEVQRDEHPGNHLSLPILVPALHEAAHAVVGAGVTLPAQCLEEPLGSPALARRPPFVLLQQRLEPRDERAKLRLRLMQARTVVGFKGRVAQVALHGVARQPRLPRDPADALALDEVPPPDLADRFHRDHPRFSSTPQSVEV
jgi:hypothetical protein